MIEKQGTWGEVTEGTTLLSPSAAPLVIVRTAPGKKGGLWYLARDHNKREFRIAPKPLTEPVTILETTPEEAELVAVHGLGAERLLDLERERRMPERSQQWKVPPFPKKGRGALDRAKDHLSWYHGTYTTDIRTLKQANEAHAEMHDPEAVGGLFMDMPHTHKED
jgi:hypothetical protein